MSSKKNKQNELTASRRKFLRDASMAATGFFIVPRHVLGRGFIAPSDRLTIAAIGSGGKGADDLRNFYGSGKVDIAFLCDVDDRSAAKARAAYPKAKYYKDFREMLDKEHKSFDACNVSIPDNVHAVAAMAVMQLGKHVYCQKPMTHDIYEARMLTQAAKRYKVVAQMGNQGSSSDGVRLMQEWYNSGAIGDATEIHIWTNRPVWPQGGPKPTGTEEVPAELNWDLWQGPAQADEYHKAFLPFNWRGWWAYGTGALGDMGCHLIDPPFKTVGLGYPSEVEASVASTYEVMWNPAFHPESCPVSSYVKMKFPMKNGKPDVALHWMDGGIRPARPDELGPNEPMGDNDGGAIITGTKGKIMCGCYANHPTLLPTSKMQGFSVPQTIARVPEGHYVQWVNACIAGYGKNTLSSPFEYAGPLTETILMGNLALRSYYIKDANNKFGGRKKLLWDAENMKITNFDEANQFVKRTYRQGWSLGV